MHNFGTVEFKVKDTPNVSFEPLKWEDTPVYCTLVLGLGSVGDNYTAVEDIVGATAKALAEAHQTEIRWNWGSSTQGHYVAPKGYVNLSTSKIVEIK